MRKTPKIRRPLRITFTCRDIRFMTDSQGFANILFKLALIFGAFSGIYGEKRPKNACFY